MHGEGDQGEGRHGQYWGFGGDSHPGAGRSLSFHLAGGESAEETLYAWDDITLSGARSSSELRSSTIGEVQARSQSQASQSLLRSSSLFLSRPASRLGNCYLPIPGALGNRLDCG